MVGEVEHIPSYLIFSNELLPFAEVASEARQQLKKSPKVFPYFRRVITKEDSNLKLEIGEIRADSNGNRIGPQTELIKIRGVEVFQSEKEVQLDKCLRGAIEILSEFGSTDDSALEYLAKVELNGTMVEAAQRLQGAKASIPRIYRTLKGFQSFFDTSNFQAMQKWAQSDECPEGFIVEFSEFKRLIMATSAQHQFWINVSKLLEPLPKPKDSVAGLF